MASDDAEQLEWRDTYYVFFRGTSRPTLTQVEHAIASTTRGVTLENLEADDDGMFQSILIQAPEDNAALEVSYESGEAVVEQSAALAKQLQHEISGDQLQRLVSADARFDVMHFERVSGETYSDDEDMPDDAMDPSSLLSVLEALAKLTDGMPIDPASGAILT